MHSAEHSILMSQWPDAGNAYILASNDQHQINNNNQISHTQNKQQHEYSNFRRNRFVVLLVHSTDNEMEMGCYHVSHWIKTQVQLINISSIYRQLFPHF